MFGHTPAPTIGILSQLTTRQACNIHTNIILIMGQDGKASEAKAGNKYSVWAKN